MPYGDYGNLYGPDPYSKLYGNNKPQSPSPAPYKAPDVLALEARYNKAHAEAIRTGNWAENDRLKLELQNLGKFKRELRWFDEEQGQFTEALRRGFRTSTEFTAARQKRGVEQGVGRYFARRGLGESGFEGQGAATAFGNIALASQGAQNQFEQALNMSLSQERSGFIRGEFDFFHRLSQMQYEEQLGEKMAAFQAQLQRDAQRAGMFDKMLNFAGQVLGGFIPIGGGMPGAAQTAGQAQAQTYMMNNPYAYYG